MLQPAAKQFNVQHRVLILEAFPVKSPRHLSRRQFATTLGTAAVFAPFITRNLNAARLQKILEEGVTTNALAPYAFSDGVLMKVRSRVAAGNREQP